MGKTVSVFGLGYVGCVSAACLARAGHRVIGVDINPAKVRMVNAGRSPIVEPGVRELVEEMVADNRLSATLDGPGAVAESDISMVAVGTPSLPNGDIDLQYVQNACREIGSAARNKSARHILVVRSTVLPGTMEDDLIPLLEAELGPTMRERLGLCINPEFLREGSSLADFDNPPFTLIGTDECRVATEVAELYEELEAPVHMLPFKAAEMVKYACNAFHGVKVSFANEVGNVCKALGIDSHQVMQVFCEDKRLNLSSYYLKPGFAFGGSCLPKDLRALLYKAKQVDVATPLLLGTMETNRLQVERAVELVLATGYRRIGVLGLSFKAGTDDLRESPMVKLVESLIGKGLELAIFDRDVSEAQVLGANREYIEREIPHIWSLMRSTVADVLARADTVIIGKDFRDPVQIAACLTDRHTIVDLVRVFENSSSGGHHYHGICW